MIKLSNIRVPDTLVLILLLMAFAWLLTGIIPAGSFETTTVHYEYNDRNVSKDVLDAGSFKYDLDQQG